jgi:hypothetical protein
MKKRINVTLLVLYIFFIGCKVDKTEPMTAAGKPAEGNIDAFLGEAQFDVERIFEGNRFPNVVVGVDGTVMAFWGRQMLPHVRRSEDGGTTWGHEIEIGDDPEHAGRGLGAAVVDETTGDIIVFMDGGSANGTSDWYIGHSWRSRDNGNTWIYNGASEEIIKANTAIDIGGQKSIADRAILHGNDRGITLRHGENKGRLVIGARNWSRPNQSFSQSDKYNCAIYSDDGGKTWRTSAPFPVFGTGEGAVAELSNGHIYHSSRKNYFLEGEEFRHERHFAWSYDGGETWQDPALSRELPDGPRYRGEERRGANYNGHFGMMGGLVRLPVKDRDILIYSNADTPTHNRINGTVWASFDGGISWPVKRLVHDGPFAYSSLAAGRPETPSEGYIFLQFEGGVEHHYEAGYVARFNLAWLIEGVPTGDGEVPEWVK